MNIKVKLYHDSYAEMSADKTLDGFFPVNSAELQREMTEAEFDDFCKANNLITYRQNLKRYQDGVTCGTFSVT
jgi:hypothetical protein